MITEKADKLMGWLNSLREIKHAHKNNEEFLKLVENVRDVLAQELIDELDNAD